MRPQIILFGDSITQQSFAPGGWGPFLSDNFVRKADVLNRGYGGYNTRWALFLLHYIFPLALEKHPVAATIFFGANDAALLGKTSSKQHVPVEEYKENLGKMIRHLKECLPQMLVVLITPPPIDEDGRMNYASICKYALPAKLIPAISWMRPLATLEPSCLYMETNERTNETAGIYSSGCVEVANELNVRSINLWSKMQEIEGWQKKFLSDGLHLTPEGNTVVYMEVVEVFDQARLSSADMPYDFPHRSQIDYKNPEKAFQIHCSEE